MQATTLQNVKRAKGVDIEVIEKSGSQNISRQQVADAKKLKRYINQLTIAKAECETALRKLGWDGAFPTVESDSKVKVIDSPFIQYFILFFLLDYSPIAGQWFAPYLSGHFVAPPQISFTSARSAALLCNVFRQSHCYSFAYDRLK